MIRLGSIVLLLQVAGARPAPVATGIPVQLAVSVTRDTVTVGERFVVVLRVRAPAGATITFPESTDSATQASATGMQLIGKPAFQSPPGSVSMMMTAAYRMAAWDIGFQPFSLPDVIVNLNGTTGYVSLGGRGVFVRSVLPEDSALRIAKPPRPAIGIRPFNWLPWLIALAVLIVAGLAWRAWIWYRRRRDAPVDPYTAAQREFARVEAMQLARSGEAERHVALMSNVMRRYLSARVPGIDDAQTSSELLVAAPAVHARAPALGDVLWRADLVKFAGIRVTADDAERLGSAARSIVGTIEQATVADEKQAAERVAA
ncbi:MAG: DUF4381 family protein [Gemmatimonadaceae bacterium]